MSKLMVQLFMLQTKALVNAYTWTTLPLYALTQRPWRQISKSKSFDVRVTKDKHGRTIYSRPMSAHIPDHPLLQYSSVAEIVKSLDRNRKVIGIRDIITQYTATDERGYPILIDGKPLQKVKLSDQFRWITVGEAMDRIDAMGRGLREIGVRPGDKVLIYADNSVEWFYVCLALARINAVTVTLFSTLGDSGVVYGINQSDTKCVITSENLLDKLNKLSSQFEQLKTIIYIRDKVSKSDSENKETAKNTEKTLAELSDKKMKLFSFEQVQSMGAAIPEYDFPAAAPDDILLIMYTSGTTGNPKGVIVTHRQFITSMFNLLRKDMEGDLIGFSSVFAGYLPMAHLFGYIMNIGMFFSDSKIALCSPLTLFDSSPAHVSGQSGDIKLISPEFFVAVPLVLERLMKEIYRKLNERSPLALPIFSYLMDYKIRWTARGFDTPIINRIICRKINEQFGGRLRLIGVSSAPLHERTQALVQAALNVKVVQAYGSTEMCGGSHVLSLEDLSYGTVGVPYHSVKYYLKDWPEGGYSSTDKPNPRGEIVTGGDTIANGYYKLPDETEESFYVDENGVRWFHSGDIGEVLPNGTLKIIDRKKDLTKLANGEFVSLGKIESGLRNSQYVENICACTDPYSNYVTALISPNRTAMIKLAKELNIDTDLLGFEQLCDDKLIAKHIFQSIAKLASDELGLKRREIPAAITLVKEEWTQDNNLLTAAFKLKRKQVNDFYSAQIKTMFAQIRDTETEVDDQHMTTNRKNAI